jgi:riboflavin kinase/FMN adenylyltransferase
LGHQKILQYLEKKAKKSKLFSLVVTFSPHPEKILGKAKIKEIQTLDQRLKEIEMFDVQAVCVIVFDKEFSNFSSREFIQEFVAKKLKAKEVIVGENFRFGKNREGDVSTLKRLAKDSNLHIHSIPPVTLEGKIISSSLIRNLLEEGFVEKANVLLGRPYSIVGKVIKGKSRGKSLGFPTANIATKNEIVPSGIFITTTKIDSETLPSLTNVGDCPTFKQQERNIESYIINFNQNLYGKKIGISFIKKIREEKKFKTPEELSLQIKTDLKTAREYFNLK